MSGVARTRRKATLAALRAGMIVVNDHQPTAHADHEVAGPRSVANVGGQPMAPKPHR